MPQTISVASYIFKRLQQNGVNHVFGVPGDYMLKALDHVKASGVKWTGTCNELNAGYAADGYARTNGLGALFTTYGVGELSAINAVAGSYAERVPVVHVVGLPRREHLERGKLVHHSLMRTHVARLKQPLVFSGMHESVTGARFDALSRDSQQIIDSVDDVIRRAIVQRVPTYIPLPSDMVAEQVQAQQLSVPLRALYQRQEDSSEDVANDLLRLLYSAKAPLLLVDRAGTDHPESLRQLLNDFIRCSGIPTLTMPSGASMVDHNIKNYYGVHAGPAGQIDTMPYVNACDLVVSFSCMHSDTQTLGWSVVPPRVKTVAISRSRLRFFNKNGGQSYEISVERMLAKMIAKLDTHRLAKPDTTSLGNFRKVMPQLITSLDDPIDQTSFYLRLNSYLRPHDTILLANATPILGGRDFVLPDKSCRVIASGLWFSIGHMLPAALGAAMAQQRSPQSSEEVRSGRVVLLDGDGSFQVTAQELSTIIHQRLNVTIFIINNDGYAYERLIHNPDEDYHDIAPWDYLSLPATFGAAQAIKKAEELGEDYSVDTYTMRTWKDLEAFLSDDTFDNGFGGKAKRGLKLIDVKMAKTDVPEKFKAVFASAGKNLD
ncbi:hypothetical protein OHC33_010871 [Knufia fluminis]|uniref:Pyruvate decarboxylase n=1 Tax=Knufia fluminis TaxID=191047 RepID=A0AAN8E8L2_9EURO|nr:hypothetical protein OHC33_010871 [Knufia fluminis]